MTGKSRRRMQILVKRLRKQVDHETWQHTTGLVLPYRQWVHLHMRMQAERIGRQ